MTGPARDGGAARTPRAGVAVVGAGIAGLAAAGRLSDLGHEVHVFERARGVGGRAATRRRDGHAFDHGAQYFTARDPGFSSRVESWLAAGCVARWEVSVAHSRRPTGDDGEARYVGVPGMSALAGHLARGLDLRLQTRVEAARREPDGWRLQAVGDSRGYDALVVATPPEQALPLLHAAPGMAARVASLESLPCWCVMVAFDTPLDAGHDALRIAGSPLEWAARDSTKPGRGTGERWVLHATPGWSRPRLDADGETLAAELLAAFFAATGVAPRRAAHVAAHRWRFARVARPIGEDCLWDEGLRLAACGDWCREPRVEDAFLSGIAAADRIAGSLPPAR